ncbi:glycosyltransferase family 39 protein, partial [Candidatus Woesearchaeota archaeon]|nr:glycosyltransferase family 39 protein [Candidatus Woesearchaeota archaeon]
MNQNIKSKELIVLSVLILLSTIISLGILFLNKAESVGADEGIYLYNGFLLTKGYRVYTDFYNGMQKLPGMIYVVSFFTRMHGNSWESILALRMLSIAVKAITIICIYYAGKILINRNSGLFAAAVFAFDTIINDVSTQVLTQPYSTLFIALAMIMLAKSRNVFSGICISLAFIFRPSPIIVLLPMVLVTLTEKNSLSDKLKNSFYIGLGFALGILPVLVFLWLNNSLVGLYKMLIQFHFLYEQTPLS